MINTHIKIFQKSLTYNFNAIIISVLLGLAAIALNNTLLIFPVLIAILLISLYGEKFLITLILIALFTLVGEVNPTLRTIVHIVNFTLLGILFLKRFGLEFNSYPRIPKTILYFLLLYAITFILSSIMSNYPLAGVGVFTRQAAFFVIAYVLFALINDENTIKLYLTSFLIVSFILVTASLIVFVGDGINLLEIISPNRPRISAIISNPEASTNFFVLSFPFIISFILIEGKKFKKKISYLLLFYFSLGLILIMSRSAILGILLSTAIILFLLRRKKFFQLLISLSVVALVFVFYPPLNDLMTTFLRIESGMSARDYVWKMSMDMIEDNTIFGIGPGAYQYEMLNYFPYLLSDWWGKLFIYYNEVTGGVNLSHNFFLSLFTDMGILGILTAIALPIVYLRIGIKTIKKYKLASPDRYYLIVALFAAGSSIILRNFFNGIGLLYVGGLQTDLPFWLIFGSLVYFYQLPLNSEIRALEANDGQLKIEN